MSRPVKASIDMSALRQNQHIVRRAAPARACGRWSKPMLMATAWQGLERA
jgi:hypothetical protein